MAGRTQGSLRRRVIIESAATKFVLYFAASCGVWFQVVMSIGYFAVNEPPLTGDPARLFPWKLFSCCSQLTLACRPKLQSGEGWW
jgi:hypothetical protein